MKPLSWQYGPCLGLCLDCKYRYLGIAFKLGLTLVFFIFEYPGWSAHWMDRRHSSWSFHGVWSVQNFTQRWQTIH